MLVNATCYGKSCPEGKKTKYHQVGHAFLAVMCNFFVQYEAIKSSLTWEQEVFGKYAKLWFGVSKKTIVDFAFLRKSKPKMTELTIPYLVHSSWIKHFLI